MSEPSHFAGLTVMERTLWHWNLLTLICRVCLNFSRFEGKSTGSDYERWKWRLAIPLSAAAIVIWWTVLSVASFFGRSCEECCFVAVHEDRLWLLLTLAKSAAVFVNGRWQRLSLSSKRVSSLVWVYDVTLWAFLIYLLNRYVREHGPHLYCRVTLPWLCLPSSDCSVNAFVLPPHKNFGWFFMQNISM